ncbi:MAG: hypothetical protein K0Q52_2625, partial [Microbacterium sp.]|nr:hypothetical protein [Microbacterium sp.]
TRALRADILPGRTDLDIHRVDRADVADGSR